jgi:carbonic anhydrase/acetyltransferase-like protein (isoleucine patch superfamily)
MTIRTFQNHQPDIDDSAYVDETALVIGQVTMGKDSSVWPMTVIRGDINTVTIGERSNIQDATICHVSHDGPYSPGGACLTIGSDVTVGHSVVLHACTLEDQCLIGIGSVVLDKAIIRKHVILGAGSLVPGGKELESGYLYMGRPAKQIRALTQQEIESLDYSAQHYVKVKNMHQA